MRLINTTDLSLLLDECCDSNYNKFNGSVYSTDTHKYIVWRAQSRPVNINCREVGRITPLPIYPYITISGS